MTSDRSQEILDKIRAHVGKEVVIQSPDEFSRASFRKYALAIGDFNPLYRDREFAKKYGLRDVMAPPTLICDTWQYFDSLVDERGDIADRHQVRVVPNGLRAGNDYEFFQAIHPDDIITAKWKIKDVWEKSGRSGRLVFQMVELAFYNQRNELLTINREVMAYSPDQPKNTAK